MSQFLAPEHAAGGAVAAPGAPSTQSSPAQIYDTASVRRAELGLKYAGAVTPPEAWTLMRAQKVLLIDVRTAPEHKFVGRVPGSPNVEWHGADPAARAAFLEELAETAKPTQPLLFLCRSGVRSHAAATAAFEAGYQRVYNVLEGFEGQIDAAYQRGKINGWRFHGLPWVQD
jgi:rhodanese-related sulfurtransferase